jgi:hypothetical protein
MKFKREYLCCLDREHVPDSGYLGAEWCGRSTCRRAGHTLSQNKRCISTFFTVRWRGNHMLEDQARRANRARPLYSLGFAYFRGHAFATAEAFEDVARRGT